MVACRHRQLQRQGKLNADLSPKEISAAAKLNAEASQLLEHAVNRLGLSARGYHRVLKIALTLADMLGEPCQANHIAEALAYRKLDSTL